MTENIGWAELGVRPDTTGFSSSLSRQVDPSMDSLGRRSASRFSAGFKRAAVSVGLGVTAAVGGAVKLAADSLGEAREAQKVGAQTAAVLKSTGQAAKVSEAQVGRYATRLSNVAGIDDELIQSGENVLLTFKDIRNEAGKGDKIFKRATKTALDMSVALGTDLKGSAIQVGKALNDPVKGVTALQRVGVSFTNLQRAQIKALVEGGDANAAMATGLIQTSTEFSTLLKGQNGDLSKTVDILTHDLTPAQKKTYDMYAEGGHTLDAQKRILRELSSEFSGSAKAQATASDKLKVAFGNLEEEIGTALLPYMDDLANFLRKEGIPAVRDFFHWVSDDGAPAIKKVGGFLKSAGGHAKNLIGYLKDLPDPAKYAGLIALVGGVATAKLRSGGGALGGAGRALGLSAPVKVFVTNPGFGKPGTTSTSTTGGKGSGRGTAAALLGLPILDELSGGKASDVGLHPLRELGAEFSLPFTSKGRKELFGPSIEEVTKQLIDSAKYWHDYEFNGLSAFRAVDRAIENATPLMVRYNRVLDGTPRQVKTWVGLSGYEKAMQQIHTLIDGIHAIPTAGLDNGVPFVSGGGGVNINVGRVETTDPNKFVQWSQQKAQQAGMGGRP